MTLLRWVDLESNNYQISIIENGEFCKVKASGEITYRATLFALVRLVTDFQFKSSYRIILDFENTKFAFTNEEISGLINYLHHIKSFFPNRFAIILPEEDTVLGSLLASRCKRADLSIDFFLGSELIEHWLENTPSY